VPAEFLLSFATLPTCSMFSWCCDLCWVWRRK